MKFFISHARAHGARPKILRRTALLVLAAAIAAPALPATPAETARALQPYDLTGYWVSLITQDWRVRMLVPPKGDYIGIPINLAAQRVADAWSASVDEASGQACKAYGVGTLMRIPERLHIHWSDDNTLRIDTDAGMQTRLLRFRPSAGDLAAAPNLQGLSVAFWVGRQNLNATRAAALYLERRGTTPATFAAMTGAPPFDSLAVVTGFVSPGYLRKNGVPYGDKMTMSEYWDEFELPSGQTILTIPTTVSDPEYLQQNYYFTSVFRREADASKWSPAPCSLRR